MRHVKNFFKYTANYFRVIRLLSKKSHIVFYIEQSGDWSFFRKTYMSLVDKFKDSILILTSEVDIKYPEDKKVFQIGSGFWRVLMFINLRNCVMVLTMTDLGNLELKRSLHGIKYVYLFHSLASTRAVYLEGAFDNYDYILCSTRDQYLELADRKGVISGEYLNLYKVGYEKVENLKELTLKKDKNEKLIMFAPTWSRETFDVDFIKKIITSLCENYKIIVQLHPMTQRIFKNEINSLNEYIISAKNVDINFDINNLSILSSASCLITDWSGIAFEYAFGTERPVISIDTPQKIRNINVTSKTLDTFERVNRNKIGKVISPEDIFNLKSVVQYLLEHEEIFKGQIRELKAKSLLHFENSEEVNSKIISRIFLDNSLN